MGSLVFCFCLFLLVFAAVRVVVFGCYGCWCSDGVVDYVLLRFFLFCLVLFLFELGVVGVPWVVVVVVLVLLVSFADVT